MNNLSSYCGLVDAKIRASDKDLPVNKLKFPLLTIFLSIPLNKLPPAFHEEHFRAEFCSLAIVRTRVFVLMDLLCDILQIAMIDGKQAFVK